MTAIKIAAIALILCGVLGLAYGGFSYTKETHGAKLGPIELSIKDKQTVKDCPTHDKCHLRNRSGVFTLNRSASDSGRGAVGTHPIVLVL